MINRVRLLGMRDRSKGMKVIMEEYGLSVLMLVVGASVLAGLAQAVQLLGTWMGMP